MELAFSYDARPLDKSYINNKDSHDLSFANDFIEKQEVQQLSFQQLLLSYDQKEIKSLWGISYLISSDTHHLVILLDNGMYKCSCMSLINRGTVCRHYFCVMLQTSQAQFHIGFLNPRWFVETSPDLRSRPFCPASKFKMDSVVSYLESNNPPNFFHSINENILNRNNPYVTLSKQKLYYMNIKEPDQENAEQLGNPIIQRPKGRPLGVARYKNPLEESSKPNEGTCRRKINKINVVCVIMLDIIVQLVLQIQMERKGKHYCNLMAQITTVIQAAAQLPSVACLHFNSILIV
ncbi:hypothetical protein RirG_256900 [Rhizophagus irregularis DAOM 197198w]|uniref:SWIM-type domain-containing protein n=2 Tax=Rhizophagus irregularis TaxID=588596 RepID=A0A015JAS8_RHIIW|nr:hypothetical protein RirG_256900 [Rhizophagus irregularis DAOM 197198w]